MMMVVMMMVVVVVVVVVMVVVVMMMAMTTFDQLGWGGGRGRTGKERGRVLYRRHRLDGLVLPAAGKDLFPCSQLPARLDEYLI